MYSVSPLPSTGPGALCFALFLFSSKNRQAVKVYSHLLHGDQRQVGWRPLGDMDVVCRSHEVVVKWTLFCVVHQVCV